MIDRYTRPEMGRIWELENKFEIWKEIEVLACEAQAELGQVGITAEEAAHIRDARRASRSSASTSSSATLNHDVIAFLTNMAEHIDAGIPRATQAEPLGPLRHDHRRTSATRRSATR